MNSNAMYFTPVRYGGFSDYLGVFIGYFQYYLYGITIILLKKYFHNVPKEIKKGKTTKYLVHQCMLTLELSSSVLGTPNNA